MRRFRILPPFTIYMCRNEVAEVTVNFEIIDHFYPKNEFMNFGLQNGQEGVKYSALYSTDHMTCFSLWITILACSESKLSAKSHFGHLWVFDLCSEVTGWPRTLNFCITCFVSWWATRWFLSRNSSSIIHIIIRHKMHRPVRRWQRWVTPETKSIN